MTFVPEPNLASVVISRLSRSSKKQAPDKATCWQFPTGTLYDHPTKPARFIANERARNDLRWWRSILRGEGLPASPKFISNDFWNFEVVGLLQSLYHRAVDLEPFHTELEAWWHRLSDGQSQPIEFHPSNFWSLNRREDLEYLPGLTDLYWPPTTHWSEVWGDFRARAPIGPIVAGYGLETFPEIPAPRYWYRGEPLSFAEYVDRGVIRRELSWPRHWEFYLGDPRFVTPATANPTDSHLELRYPVHLPTAPLTCWTNLRRVISLSGHTADAIAEWLNGYLTLLGWVAEQPEELWSDFLPPYFLWEEPLGKVLPSKVVLGLFAPADYQSRTEGLHAMTRAWARCLLYSLPRLDEPELLNLLNQLLDHPVDPNAALHPWQTALRRSRFSKLL